MIVQRHIQRNRLQKYCECQKAKYISWQKAVTCRSSSLSLSTITFRRNGLIRYPRIPLGSSAYTMGILIISAICKGLAVPIFRTRFLTRNFIFFLTIRRHLYLVGVSPFFRLFARFAAKKATSRDFITKSRSSSVRL